MEKGMEEEKKGQMAVDFPLATEAGLTARQFWPDPPLIFGLPTVKGGRNLWG